VDLKTTISYLIVLVRFFFSYTIYFVDGVSGQIELYTHHPFLPTLVQNLSRLGMRTCAVYLVESQFMEDRYKFFRYVRDLSSFTFS
jgi:hypothetical protein